MIFSGLYVSVELFSEFFGGIIIFYVNLVMWEFGGNYFRAHGIQANVELFVFLTEDRFVLISIYLPIRQN